MTKSGLESKFVVPKGNKIGELSLTAHEIQALDDNFGVACVTKYDTHTQGVQVYDCQGNLIFEAMPGTGNVQVTNKSPASTKDWANYFSQQANVIRNMSRTDRKTDEDLNVAGMYNGAYNILINAARTLNSGAYMRTGKKAGK